jgi:hypothetical protein
MEQGATHRSQPLPIGNNRPHHPCGADDRIDGTGPDAQVQPMQVTRR